MRIAHAADCHLGFRQFQRLAPNGVNRRELDVQESFGRMIDGMIERAPDLVVIAGDLFHAPKPPNQAVIEAMIGMRRLTSALPRMPIVICGGNHDTGTTTETGSILPLFGTLGAHVATYQSRSFRLGDVHVRAVPERAGPSTIGTPDDTARLNVLVFHGECNLMPHASAEARQAADFAGWDYVALGHYHQQKHAGMVGYAGSIDFTSSNPWDETQPKGWCLVDTDTGTVEHIPTHPRPHIQLPILSHHGVEPDALVQQCIAALLPIPDGAVVRQVIEDASREQKHALEVAMKAVDTRRLLAYQLDIRKASMAREVRAAVRRESLDQMLTEKLRARLDAAPDLSEADLIALNRKYLERAEDMTQQYEQAPLSTAIAA